MTRKRLARLVLMVAVAVVAVHLLQALPREVAVEYVLGPDHRAFTEARISYLREGERMKGARFHYEHGAPPTLQHEVELPPGSYEIVAELSGPGLQRTVTRSLEVPTEGPVRIDLFDRAYARAPPVRALPAHAGGPRTLPSSWAIPVQWALGGRT